ncbi:MAG: IPTL-CTERM sorting domain-containing protein [Parahaliea sp.]
MTPGRYQLEADVVDGWVDGTWMAGSGGGTAQPGLIEGIVLTAGMNSNGYLIAKRKPDGGSQGTEQADLSITIQADPAQLYGGQSSQVVVIVSNAGDIAAEDVTAQVVIPDGLNLQSHTVSSGNPVSNYAAGIWTLAKLARGQSATLTLDIQAELPPDGQDRNIDWPVSVSGSTSDLQTANNSTVLGLTVLAGTVGMEQILPAQARVLILLSCPQAVSDQRAACEAQAAQNAHNLLADSVHTLQTVTTRADWHIAQRSGIYNMLWLHGGAGKLDEQALAEIRAAVRRGATLITDGLPDARGGTSSLESLADVMRAQTLLPAIGNDQTVQFPGEPTRQPVVGALYGLQLQSQLAQPLATSASSGAVVISSGVWGQGQSWVVGFDLLATLQSPAASSSYWRHYVSQQLQAFTPVSRANPALAGALLPLETTVRNNAGASGDAQNIRLRVQLPPDLLHSDVAPVPVLDDLQQVEWNWDLAPAASAVGNMRLGLPQTSGTWDVQTSLLDDNDDVLDVKTQSVTVLGLDTLVPQISEALAVLTGTTTAMQTAIEVTRQAASEAWIAQQQGDWDAALQALAALQVGLDVLAGGPYNLDIEPLRLDVARWIGITQQSWVSPDVVQADRLVVVAGGSQSAVVSTAFASPLQVRAEDANGQPVAGFTVHFVAPTDGASARFTGGQSGAAVVKTDAQGLAVSPDLIANATAGSYVVTAQGNGLASVSFALVNRSAGVIGTPASLRVVSGSGQTAQAGAMFDAPMVVQALTVADQPVSGVSVHFVFADQGASARFDGDHSSVQVLTDANGQAVSPLFSANLVAGAHQASASMAGLAGAVNFTLVNFAPGSSGKTFQGATTTGTGTVSAAISGGGDRCVFDPQATRMVPPEGVWKPLEKFLLPHGLFDFVLVGCEPGSEVTISTTWPNLRGITGYMKYGQNAHSSGRSVWYPPRGLKISGKTITFTIRDGGWGDNDLATNGIIRDPGGPSISRDIEAIPALGYWAFLLLSTLLGLLGLRRHQQASTRLKSVL